MLGYSEAYGVWVVEPGGRLDKIVTLRKEQPHGGQVALYSTDCCIAVVGLRPSLDHCNGVLGVRHDLKATND